MRNRLNKQEKLFFIKLILSVLLIGGCIFLKTIYRELTPSQMKWLITPVTLWVELSTGKQFFFDPATGYRSMDGSILISKSCSGINLLILTSLIGIIYANRQTRESLSFIKKVSLTLILSYILTLLSNVIRINASLFFLPFTPMNPLFHQTDQWYHLVIGTFVYLFFIALFYILIQFFHSPGDFINKIKGRLIHK